MKYFILIGTRSHDILSAIEKHLPAYLSKNNHVFCVEYPQFLQSWKIIFTWKPLLEKISPKLYIFHSIGLFPFGRSFMMINHFNHWINRLILKYVVKYQIADAKTCIITFTPELVFFASEISNNNIYYYVTDEFTSFPYWKNILQRKQFIYLEKELLKITKKVIVTSNTLLSKYRQLHKRVILFPIPSFSRIFTNYQKASRSNLSHISPPTAGFIGTYHDWKIDTNFLIKLIKKFSNVSFVFLGIINIKNLFLYKKLFNLNNFHFLGNRRIDELPPYVSKFDVCLIPYRTNKWGHTAYPVKIMEYLALGKPVVTTALPSIKYLAEKKLIYWSKNDEEFNENILKALQEKPSLELKRKRLTEALRNDWGIRIKQFIKLINE